LIISMVDMIVPLSMNGRPLDEVNSIMLLNERSLV